MDILASGYFSSMTVPEQLNELHELILAGFGIGYILFIVLVIIIATRK